MFVWFFVPDASDGHEAVTLFTAERFDFCQHRNIKMIQCHEWCCGPGGGVRTPKPAVVALRLLLWSLSSSAGGL